MNFVAESSVYCRIKLMTDWNSESLANNFNNNAFGLSKIRKFEIIIIIYIKSLFDVQS